MPILGLAEKPLTPFSLRMAICLFQRLLHEKDEKQLFFILLGLINWPLDSYPVMPESWHLNQIIKGNTTFCKVPLFRDMLSSSFE